MPRSCIVLFSGGLDSRLVLRLMTVQGLDVIALHAVNNFHGTERTSTMMEGVRAAALELGAKEVLFPDMSEDVIAVVRQPRFGYGRNLNPCIDCRIRTVNAGFMAMREHGAEFVVSGEVVGQRPMSQRRDAIKTADREIASWGFAGLFLRPLSAGLLDKTVPEAEGWVDPERLYSFSGRGRGPQAELAEELGIVDYPSPAGGCLLTDAGFSARLRDLMRFQPDWSGPDVELLKIGRHFLPGPKTRIVASRREDENRRLPELARPDDFLYINDERNGAIVLLRGEKTPEFEAMAAGLAVYFSKMRDTDGARVKRWREDNGQQDAIATQTRGFDADAARNAEKHFKERVRDA